MNGSQRAYARHRAELGLPGATHTAVAKAVRSKRIPVAEDGSIDFECADAAWTHNSEPSVPTATAGRVEPRAPARRHAPVNEKTDEPTFLSARTRKELADAKRAELRYYQDSKALLPAADVQRTMQQIGKIYASARGAVPAQLATKLVGKTDLAEIERIIRDELNATDNRICDELAARFPDLVDSHPSDDTRDQ